MTQPTSPQSPGAGEEMNLEEALAWLRGERSMINVTESSDQNLWYVRTAEADAAMTQQAYWVAKAHQERLVHVKERGEGES